MFFIFSKILYFIFTPILWILGLLLFSLFSKNTLLKRKTFVASVISLFLFSNTFVFEEVMRLWEIPGTQYNQLDSTYEAGIVLGGMMRKDNELDRIQFYRGSDRLMQCIELYKKGIVKKIFIVAGSGSLEFPENKEAYYAERFLLTIGIHPNDFILETKSRNTHENALLTKHFVDSIFPPNTKFLLITSASHMRRAKACFDKEGINVQSYSTDRLSSPRDFTPQAILVPEADTLCAWNAFFHETLGYLIYKLQGYL